MDGGRGRGDGWDGLTTCMCVDTCRLDSVGHGDAALWQIRDKIRWIKYTCRYGENPWSPEPRETEATRRSVIRRVGQGVRRCLIQDKWGYEKRDNDGFLNKAPFLVGIHIANICCTITQKELFGS